jgi:hypothetical protein
VHQLYLVVNSLTKLYVTYQTDIFIITLATDNSFVLFVKYVAAVDLNNPFSVWLVYWEGTSRSRDITGRNLLNVCQGSARFEIYCCHTE